MILNGLSDCPYSVTYVTALLRAAILLPEQSKNATLQCADAMQEPGIMPLTA